MAPKKQKTQTPITPEPDNPGSVDGVYWRDEGKSNMMTFNYDTEYYMHSDSFVRGSPIDMMVSQICEDLGSEEAVSNVEGAYKVSPETVANPPETSFKPFLDVRLIKSMLWWYLWWVFYKCPIISGQGKQAIKDSLKPPTDVEEHCFVAESPGTESHLRKRGVFISGKVRKHVKNFGEWMLV